MILNIPHLIKKNTSTMLIPSFNLKFSAKGNTNSKKAKMLKYNNQNAFH